MTELRPAEPRSALLDQLAKCQADSNALISSMQGTFKSRFDRSDVLLQLTTKYLLVGRCDNRFAGVARFSAQEVVYAFEHPHHRQVEMHMRYADMIDVRTVNQLGSRVSAPELRFRIGSPLAYFSREYDPTNMAHELRIGFASEADFRQMVELVLPQIRTLARPRL